MPERDDIIAAVGDYYTRKVEAHGPTPSGADWRDAESQELRFRQLLRLAEDGTPFSISDYGCGYGALADYLREHEYDYTYQGFDISESMLKHTRADERARFVSTDADLAPADYTVASGIFNVRLDVDDEAWREYVLATIGRMDVLSTRGLAFNMLTSYSDTDKMRDDLYYGDPAFYFDFCKRHLSPQVALLHDYGLWEWTILVRK